LAPGRDPGQIESDIDSGLTGRGQVDLGDAREKRPQIHGPEGVLLTAEQEGIQPTVESPQNGRRADHDLVSSRSRKGHSTDFNVALVEQTAQQRCNPPGLPVR
jgi:hypothetical protein